MPYYAGLKQIEDAKLRHRTIEGLRRLRSAFATGSCLLRLGLKPALLPAS